MILSTALCVIAMVVVLGACRTGSSVGLPIAYIAALLLVHLPGGFVHLWIGDQWSFYYRMTAAGFRIAAVAAIAFAAGVWLAKTGGSSRKLPHIEPRRRLLLFCLLIGWLFTVAYPFLIRVPVVAAFAAKAAPIWIVGAALGLRAALIKGEMLKAAAWALVIACFPAFTLLSIGFLASAAVATFIAAAPSLLLIRRLWIAVSAVWASSVAMIFAFVNYFINRDAIRDAVWGGAALSVRLGRVFEAGTGFRALDLSDVSQVTAIDQRLNQNFFVGVAADRIRDGSGSFLYGRSLLDGFLALIPRPLWPDKPLAGSGNLVRDATGMWSQLSDTASWGVGVVMEFYINFGWIGVSLGMALLGYGLSRLDGYVHGLLQSRNDARLIPAYLVGIALIFPEGSFVDIIGGAGVALLAGIVLARGYAIFSRSADQKLRPTSS